MAKETEEKTASELAALLRSLPFPLQVAWFLATLLTMPVWLPSLAGAFLLLLSMMWLLIGAILALAAVLMAVALLALPFLPWLPEGTAEFILEDES